MKSVFADTAYWIALLNPKDATCSTVSARTRTWIWFPLSSALFRRAVNRYARRKDKAWSLVDCASFLIMKEHGITDALTPDIHFQQAGFEVMLSG